MDVLEIFCLAVPPNRYVIPEPVESFVMFATDIIADRGNVIVDLADE